VHGWWLNRGAKISKSKASSVVDTAPYVEKFGPDALRYFVLREMVLGQDADFSDERFETRYTGDLGKKLGNLVQRTLSMINAYRAGVIPNYDGFHLIEADATLRADKVVEDYTRAVEQFAPHLALQAVWEFVAQANEYIEKTQPFKLAKDPAQTKRLDVILALLAESLRRLSVLVQAALPYTAEKIRAQMQLTPGPVRLEEALFGNSLRGHTVGKPQVLFPPIEEKPPVAP
jgi:methionyl-tRNA synthetase